MASWIWNELLTEKGGLVKEWGFLLDLRDKYNAWAIFKESVEWVNETFIKSLKSVTSVIIALFFINSSAL